MYGRRAIPAGTAAYIIIGVSATERLEELRYPQHGLYWTGNSTGCSLCPHYCLNGGRSSCSPRHSHSPVADRIGRDGNFCAGINAQRPSQGLRGRPQVNPSRVQTQAERQGPCLGHGFHYNNPPKPSTMALLTRL